MEALYKPYSKDGGTIEGAIRWLKKTTGADDAVIEAVVAETFVDLAQGASFVDPCPCGCEITRAHTHIEHYMGQKVIELKKEAEMAYSKTIQNNIRARVLAHIQAENEQFIADNTKPPRPLFDWSKSPTLKLIKKIRGK